MNEILGKAEEEEKSSEEAEKSHEAEEEAPKETIKIPEDEPANEDYDRGDYEQRHREIINPRINKPKENPAVKSAKTEGSSRTYLAVLMSGAFLVGVILYATSRKEEGTTKAGKSSQPQPDERELKSLIRMEIINCLLMLSLIHICRCRRYAVCRSRWSPYH
eukprot:TRINITY_DN14785_c0_g1_i11.p3 TRINITY_DN14785_c0_g1~~TRINITY_DN14785_c0_g1_i11.p3  ORF type:complete len:162 (-),score=37.08 TRINITY_DN14785_c0_g1_i11:16-501(-)